MWLCNRKYESTGLIPEGFLELDDLVQVENRDKLAEIFTTAKNSLPEWQGLQISAEDIQSCEDLSDWCWRMLKRVGEAMWGYIPRSGKYTHYFV